MPDPFLIGNGRWCATCHPDGPPRSFVTHRAAGRYAKRRPEATPRPGCNECAGQGRIVFSAEEIVAATVAEVRAWRERAA